MIHMALGQNMSTPILKKNHIKSGGCINIPAILMLGVPGFDPEPYFIVLVSMIYIYRYIIFHEYYIILFDAFQRLTDDFPSKPYLGIS